MLSGDDSVLFVTRLVDLLSNSTPKGGSVQLTIDQDAQDAMFDGLQGLGQGVQAAGVAIEPSTGRILAMSSLPTYDPNELASHDFSAVARRAQQLEKEESQPLLNRATQMRLPPGSTFKVVTAAAAIEFGNYDADSLVPGGPTYQLPLTSGPSGEIDNEGRDCGTNRIPFKQAMGNSCNTTFAALANEVGADEMLETAEGFGFNSHYLDDLDLQAESNFPKEMDEAQTGQSGIGQFEVSATPLQMAMVAAAIGNGGTVMKPYLVDEIRSPELDVLDKAEPEEFRQAVSQQTASQVAELMTYTVEQGTASPAAIPGIEVAGKTGTAQSGVDERAAVRVVRLVRPRRRPAGRGRDHDPEGAHPARRDRRRSAGRPDRQASHGGGDPVSHRTPEQYVDDARRYTLDSRIATGGMGEVWRGTDTLLEPPGRGQAAQDRVRRPPDVPLPLRDRGPARRLPPAPEHRLRLRLR